MYEEWLEVRKDHRRLLFGSIHEVPPADGDYSEASLALLALKTNLSSISRRETLARSRLSRSVGAILALHDQKARSPDGHALFGMASGDDLERVTALTARIVWVWERSCTRHIPELQSPFADLPEDDMTPDDFARPDVQLVVETASSVCEILQAGYPMGEKLGSEFTKIIASFIAQRGPEYAMAWIRGDIIREYCEEHGYDAEQWLVNMPPSFLADVAIMNVSNPIRKIISIVGHLKHGLSVSNIMAFTHWTEEKVRSVFPPHALLHLARQTGQFDDPLRLVMRVMRNLELVMSDDNLSKQFGLSQEEIEGIFVPWARYKIARQYHDAAEGLPDILTSIKELKRQYNLTYSLATFLMLNHHSTAHERGRQVVLETPNRPWGISEARWASIVAHYPNPADKRREKNIAAFRLWHELRHPLSFDRAGEGRRSIEDRTGDSTYDPAEMIERNEPSESLQQLAAKAGVSAGQLQRLLEHFGAGEEQASLEGNVAAIIGRLRAAARETPDDGSASGVHGVG